MKIFVKRIDENEGVQVMTIDEEGRIYVDIMDVEEFNQVYRHTNYFIAKKGRRNYSSSFFILIKNI